MSLFAEGFGDFRNACSVATRPTLDELVREAASGYTGAEALEWAQGWLAGWDQCERAECDSARKRGALDARTDPLEGAPDDDALRVACDEYYWHSYTGAALDAWVEGYRAHGRR